MDSLEMYGAKIVDLYLFFLKQIYSTYMAIKDLAKKNNLCTASLSANLISTYEPYSAFGWVDRYCFLLFYSSHLVLKHYLSLFFPKYKPTNQSVQLFNLVVNNTQQLAWLVTA